MLPPEITVSSYRPTARTAPLIALIVSLLFFPACTPKSQDEETPTSKASGTETVIVAFPVDIEGVNEVVNSSTSIHNALNYFALFLPLLEIQPDYQDAPSTFLPRLAESYEFSEDRLQLTFRLRDDVMWSDGTPTTAEDVLFTWEAQTHPDIAWPFIDSKKRITKVEVLDPYSVRFHFSEAYGTQLNEANFGVILPKHAWGRLPFSEWKTNSDWFVENLVVNGPFNLESWEPEQRVALVRNERYFEPGLPKVDRIVFEITRDAQSQISKLRSGHAHLVEYVNPPDAEQISNHPDLRLETFIPRFFYFTLWNTTRPFFADREVRQALTLATDRQAIIDTLHFGYGALSHSPYPSNSWVYNKDLKPLPYDPVRAREILERKGWIDSDGDGIRDRDGQPFRFELITNSENPLRRDITVMMQEQLRLVGIAADPRHMEFNSLLAPLSRHDFDAVVTGLAMDTGFNNRYYFHSSAIKDGYNWGSFEHAEMDQLIEAIEIQTDPKITKPLFDRLQEILSEEQPLTFLYEGRRLVGIHKSLHDVKPNAVSSFFNMRFWRLEDTE